MQHQKEQENKRPLHWVIRLIGIVCTSWIIIFCIKGVIVVFNSPTIVLVTWLVFLVHLKIIKLEGLKDYE